MKTLYFIIFLFLSTGDVSTSIHTFNQDTKENYSGLNCTQFNANGIRRCIAGINSNIMNVAAEDPQYADQWCWAASIETVLNYYGYNISQREIVFQTWGRLLNNPGTPQQILNALNRSYTDQNGRQFRVSATSQNISYAAAAQDLANNNPLIIGTLGHAMVLTAVEYNVDRFGNGSIVGAIVRDPWPNNFGRRVLTPQEWHSTSLVVRIRVF